MIWGATRPNGSQLERTNRHRSFFPIPLHAFCCCCRYSLDSPIRSLNAFSLSPNRSQEGPTDGIDFEFNPWFTWTSSLTGLNGQLPYTQGRYHLAFRLGRKFWQLVAAWGLEPASLQHALHKSDGGIAFGTHPAGGVTGTRVVNNSVQS